MFRCAATAVAIGVFAFGKSHMSGGAQNLQLDGGSCSGLI